MRINSNITAYITNNALLRNEGLYSASTKKLSSGYKITSASDNPTGYAIAGRMREQLRALERADVNATTGKSFLETADGAIDEINSMIQRLNELAVKSANGLMSKDDRKLVQDEVEQLKQEITRISETTELNDQFLLDGSFENTGYCTNDKTVSVDHYNEKVDTNTTPSIQIAESVNVANGQLTVETSGFPGTSGTVTMTFHYPKYYRECDPPISVGGTDYENEAVISGLYKDSSGRGSLKIAADGSQYITVNGSNGESMTIKISPSTAGDVGYTSMDLDGDGTDEAVRNIFTAAGAPTNYSAIDVIGSASIPTLTFELTGKGAMTLQVGANEEEKINVELPNLSLERLDLDDLDMTSQTASLHAINKLNEALKYVSSARSKLGACENRVENALSFLASSTENLNSAMSRIEDTDMAAEMTQYASYQVLTQAATSMLAQANQAPQQMLQLLQ